MGVPNTLPWLSWVMCQLLGISLSRGLSTRSGNNESWAVFLYLWFAITASKFLWGVHLNMPHLYYYMCILGETFMINQVFRCPMGKCCWRNIAEENFSLSSSYLRKQAPFILWGLMWDEYRPPRIAVLHITRGKWSIQLNSRLLPSSVLGCTSPAPIRPALNLSAFQHGKMGKGLLPCQAFYPSEITHPSHSLEGFSQSSSVVNSYTLLPSGTFISSEIAFQRPFPSPV